MITVFHAKFLTIPELASDTVHDAFANIVARLPNDQTTIKEVLDGKFKGRLEYVKVAEVNSNDLETAFRLTNHIDDNWQENAGVTAYGDYNRNRSSSSGDIFEKDGQKYVVAMFGFEELV